MQKDELEKFEKSLENVMQIAQSFGLDFFEMRFELVPADILYTFGAYQGMPTRFSHWSFGKEKPHLVKKIDPTISVAQCLICDLYLWQSHTNRLV